MNLAYIRISSNKQDCQSQRFQILEYCQKQKIILDEIIKVEVISTKSLEKRRIDELESKLSKDVLITAELSRLGRSMLEVMNLVVRLFEKGVQFVFLRQPELSSFQNPASKLLLSFYAYMAETERDFISQRTKAGLAKAVKNGKKLGRPFGSLGSKYDKDIEKVKELVAKNVPMKSIWKILYAESGKTYDGFMYWCRTRKITEKNNACFIYIKAIFKKIKGGENE